MYAIPVVLTAAVNEAPTTLGIADSTLYNLSDADIDVTLDHLKTMGVNDIRVAVPWIYIQSQDNTDYDWTKMDYIVHAASERDMNIVGVMSGTPTWAGFPINGHSDPADYARFASAVAERYNDASTIGPIDDYEIWNEPNGSLFYNPIDAKAYTAMLQAAYPAIKANNPNATVIAGVLGAVATIPGLSLAPEAFVSQMYGAGAKGYFDALSYHPYNYTLPFSLGAGQVNSPLNQVQAIRALMIANGDGYLKIWATEYGLPTNYPINQDQQAAFIHDFVVAWQNVDGAGPMFVYTTRDSNTGGFDDEENFGIFTTDWTPKEAVGAIEELIQELRTGQLKPFDVTPYANKIDFFGAAVIVVRQIINLALIVPKALFQLAVSAVTFVVESVGNLLGINSPASSVASSGAKAALATSDAVPTPRRSGVTATTPAPTVTTKKSVARGESGAAPAVSETPVLVGATDAVARKGAAAPAGATPGDGTAAHSAAAQSHAPRSSATGESKRSGSRSASARTRADSGQ